MEKQTVAEIRSYGLEAAQTPRGLRVAFSTADAQRITGVADVAAWQEKQAAYATSDEEALTAARNMRHALR